MRIFCEDLECFSMIFINGTRLSQFWAHEMNDTNSLDYFYTPNL